MLTELQYRIREIVLSEPLLEGRPVLVEDKNNLVAELEAALQTQSLAVVIAAASGDLKDTSLQKRGAWTERIEIAIHRGLLDAEDVPSTCAVLDALRERIHGAPLVTGKMQGFFRTPRHELREGGDGTYVRVLTVEATISV